MRLALQGNPYQPAQQRVRVPSPAGRGDRTQRIGRELVPGVVGHRRRVGGASAALVRSLCSASGRISPSGGLCFSGGMQLVGGIRAVREHCTRSERVESSRSDVAPHRQQASSQSWPPLPLPRSCRRRLSGVCRRPPYPRLCSKAPSATPDRRSLAPANRRPHRTRIDYRHPDRL